MKSYISIMKYIGGIAVLLLLLMSCKNNSYNEVAPRYTEYPSPAKVSVKFPKGSNLPELQFHIDNNKMRIFNKEYLPYQSKVDSAYLKMIVSNAGVVKILNETTKKTTIYELTDTGKIDLTGGRLTISIEIKDEPTLIYDMRLLTYGYDPTLYTWKLQSEELPKAATESKAFSFNGKNYWMAKDASNAISVYSFTTTPLNFSEVVGSLIPATLNVKSILVDEKNVVWGITADGQLYNSSNLLQWNEVDLGGTILTMLLSDITNGEMLNMITAVGYKTVDPSKYYSFAISGDGKVTQQETPLDSTFPVKEAYVYSYTIGGTQHSYIMGGLMADGKPAPTSFFTSDGIRWGVTPYSKGQQEIPTKGGLFLRLNQSIYAVGGVYPDNKVSNLIKMSTDRGITWAELSKNQAPGESFSERYNASGIVLNNGGAEFYIFGGLISGVPSKEIWHGWLDRTAGIINAY